MAFNYRQSVVDQLICHGVIPTRETPPEVVHDFINDLYRVEIRALRDRLLRGMIPRNEYAARVALLRDRYPVLALPIRFWTE
ncbi:MAG TPA: hypothetical protein VJX67_10395 [Blastocatellia bacterium]|nr:hypothetical protein [Blastocatellia bacterium]